LASSCGGAEKTTQPVLVVCQSAHGKFSPWLSYRKVAPQTPSPLAGTESQSAFVVQVVRQVPIVPQVYAPQDVLDTVWQVPVPLQVRAGVNVEPVQLGATQVDPIA